MLLMLSDLALFVIFCLHSYYLVSEITNKILTEGTMPNYFLRKLGDSHAYGLWLRKRSMRVALYMIGLTGRGCTMLVL